MKASKSKSCTLGCITFFLFCIFSISAKPFQVDVAAFSAILMNAESGAILFEKQPFVPIYPASTTKIATALFILDQKRMPLEQMLTVSEDSVRMKPLNKQGNFPPHWWDTDGTRMGLLAGEVISLDALLHGLMMISGNDAANVIAEGASGSVFGFMGEMNDYLKKIGCTATKFLNPHGCHHPDHVTSAYDLSVMTKKALEIPKFRELVSTLSYMKPKTNKQGASELKQMNQLLHAGAFYYPKAIGVKTGFHSAAQYALVAAASQEGRTLIAVIMGTPKRTDRYSDAIRLFETAFSEIKETRCFFDAGFSCSRQIEGAKRQLLAHLSDDLVFSYFPSEEPVCKAFIHWKTLSLPIRKGEVVGEVHIVDQQGKILGKSDLLAKEEVKGTFFFVLKEMVHKFFR